MSTLLDCSIIVKLNIVGVVGDGHAEVNIGKIKMCKKCLL